jgi:hypothetical protein
MRSPHYQGDTSGGLTIDNSNKRVKKSIKMYVLWKLTSLYNIRDVPRTENTIKILSINQPCLACPVDYHLLPITRDPGSNSQGVLMWNRDSPVSIVSLRWWPRRDSDHWLCCPSVGASLAFAPTMCKPTWSTRSHSSSVPVSHSLQVLLPASQPMESAAGGGGEPCGEPEISFLSRHV